LGSRTFFAEAIAGGAKKVRLPKAFYYLTAEQDRQIARLQADHPDVVFDYAGSEFGGSTDFLKNFTPALRAKVEALKDGETLTLEKGVYHLYATGARELFLAPSGNAAGVKRVAMPLVGKRNVTVDGGGARFIVHGGVFPFAALNCAGVTLRNCTFAAYQLPLKEFSVVEKDADGFLCQMSKDGPDYEVDPGWKRLFFHLESQVLRSDNHVISIHGLKNHNTRYLICGWHKANKPIKDRLAVPFLPTQVEDRGNGRLYFRFVKDDHPKATYVCPYAVGDPLALSLASERAVDQMFFEDCTDVAVTGVTVEQGVGMGIVAQMCRDVTIDGYRVAPLKGSLVSLTADSVYLVDCWGDLKIVNGEISWGLDDPVNVHGNYSLLAGTCKSTEGPYTFGTYLWAEFDNLPAWEKKLVEGPYIHHMSEVEGDVTEVLREFTKFVPALSMDTVDK